jgi:basic membrane protein A
MGCVARSIVWRLAGVLLISVPAQAAPPLKAAMLFPGSIADQSWNADGYAGLMGLHALGFTTAFSENVAAADHMDAMRDYAEQGNTLIIGHSGRFLSAAERVGPDYPAIQFVVAAGGAGAGGNVLSVDIDNRQFGCLQGSLAAAMSRTGKVGAVYGLEGLPTTIDEAGSFRLCAKLARPDVTVSFLYIPDMESVDAAKEAAFSLIAGGVDVVSGQLNAGQAGLIQAAHERHVFATGRSFEQTSIAPEAVLTNVIELWPQIYAAVAADVRAGHIAGGRRVYGLDTPGAHGAALGYAPGQVYGPAVPAAIRAQIDAVAARLAAGRLVITPTAGDARGGS